MYTTVAAAEGESNFVWLSKTNLYFLLELESVQSLMRVVHQIYVFMIRMQATFNDVKDWTKLTFIFEG